MDKYSSSEKIPKKMRKTINQCATGLGGAGIIGGLIGPGADLVIIAPTWVGMTITLAEQAGHEMNKQTAKKITLSIATGAGVFMAGTKVASTGIAWLTAPFTLGLSLVISAGVNAALNSSFTYAYGRAAARYFIQTEKIHNVEVMVGILMALIGAELGFDTDYDDLIY